MGFPIKKRITTSTSSGLDLLSAAICSHPQHARSNSEGTSMVTTSVAAEECSSITSDNDGETCSAAHKRAKPFPEVLMEILSNPDYASIIGWVSHGKSFAIHNRSQLSTQILPKYFRRVIFRSFIRKLNRWGFRSVKRSVSGFESTFEQKNFCRDHPELCAKLFCKSNPTSRAATKKSINITSSTTNTVSPSISAGSMPSTVFGQVVPQQAAHHLFMNSLPNEEEFQLQLSSDLILRELRQQRQHHTLMQLIHQMPMTDADIMSQYVTEKWQRILLSQQQRQGTGE